MVSDSIFFLLGIISIYIQKLKNISIQISEYRDALDLETFLHFRLWVVCLFVCFFLFEQGNSSSSLGHFVDIQTR